MVRGEGKSGRKEVGERGEGQVWGEGLFEGIRCVKTQVLR